MCESQSACFKWGCASLSNGISNLAVARAYASYGVYFGIAMVPLGYSWFHKAELGLGLGWAGAGAGATETSICPCCRFPYGLGQGPGARLE